MECELDTSILTESCRYNIMAYFVPLTFDMTEKSHIEEVTENNGLHRDAIAKCKWAKAPERRNPNQAVGHMVITFADPDSANKAILNGLVICNKKVSILKCRREPVRCLKCQGYNHVANECIIRRDICARCGEEHRSNRCHSNSLQCTPCGATGHASSNRTCPTFLRKCEEHDMKNLENMLPFFPLMESWMWEATPPNGQRTAIPVGLGDLLRPKGTGKLKQTQLTFPQRQIALNGRELECGSWDREMSLETQSQHTADQNNNQTRFGTFLNE